jgi:hypothetical protein
MLRRIRLPPGSFFDSHERGRFAYSTRCIGRNRFLRARMGVVRFRLQLKCLLSVVSVVSDERVANKRRRTLLLLLRENRGGVYTPSKR